MNKLKAAAAVAGIAATCVIGGAAQASAAPDDVTCAVVKYQGHDRGKACYHSNGDKIEVFDLRKDGYWIHGRVHVFAPVSYPHGSYSCENHKGYNTKVTCSKDAIEGRDVYFSVYLEDGDKVLEGTKLIRAHS
ncbi:hypothetical protein [Amycolatopsis viridis]|uniref:Secreted protein n=1 Tax=Amycolatopsis viridis TaxID=185678 RepID=A0ABX0T1R4_9PSEU|nr:hypothetical protein [Amycolatopsis viridis]NIH81486.1 hypothetical protein [Amycolatopsis viridis]